MIKNDIRENRHGFEYDYKFGDNVIINNHTVYKYETQYKVPFAIKRFFTNGMVNLQYVVTQIKYNIRCIEPYKSDTKVEDSSSKICMMMSTYKLPFIYFCLKEKLGKKYMIW